ncbi:MAG: sulfotransferase [Candidatus Binatia bacterium]
MRAAANGSALRSAVAAGAAVPAPIFIVGAPRSGTSLLRNLLNRHPAIALCDETYYFYYVYERRRAFGDLADPRARRRLVDRYLATTRIQRLGVDRIDLAATLIREGTSYPAFFAALLRAYAASRHKTRWGDKTPQHTLFADALCAWYPSCRLLHVVRDPRDVVASLLRMPWAAPSVLANARLWLRYTLAAEHCRKRDNYLLVPYERLVAEPASELKRICAFVAEEYVPEMLVAEQQDASDAWWFARARGPVDPCRKGIWQQQLTAKEVSLVEWLVGPHMRRFGYEPSRQPASFMTRVEAAGAEVIEDARRKIGELPRLWYFWLRPTNLAAEEAWIDAHSRAPHRAMMTREC